MGALLDKKAGGNKRNVSWMEDEDLVLVCERFKCQLVILILTSYAFAQFVKEYIFQNKCAIAQIKYCNNIKN